ncbi:MAG: hypothetical protein ABIX01_22860 [Chitinophagaceae bacterium]
MKQVFFIAVLLFCLLDTSSAQPTPPELQRKIAGKKNLALIMKEVEGFYKNEEVEKEKEGRKNGLKNKGPEGANEEAFESGLLHWKRWEYFNKTRLQPNGDLEDISAKTYAAWQKVVAKYGDETKPAGTNSLTSGSNAVWNFIGPFNLQFQGGLYRGLCRVDKIVFHPTNANIIYAGTNNGGLWRTLDGGSTWASMNFYFPIQSASGIAVNPSNPDNIFVLTGDGNGGGAIGQNSAGIWVTNDGGGNWFKTSFNSNPQSKIFNGYKLVMMPTLNYILFAATGNGLYRSTNSGSTWTLVISGQGLTDGTSPVYDVEFDPAQPGRVYASDFNRFYVSENYGASFPLSESTSLPGKTRIEIGVSPANPNYVYLLCGAFGAVGTNTFGGIYRSTSGGISGSFNLRASTPNILCWATNGTRYPNDNDQSSYDLAIDVSKSNAEVVVSGGKNIWRSTTGGTALQNLTVFNEDSGIAKFIHPDVHEIAYNPLNGWLYAGTDGGIYRSTNDGVNWTNITNGIHTTTFYHMAAAPFDVNRVLGGAQDNGVKYKSNSGDFTHITGADGFDCAFGPSTASSIYSTVNSSVAKFDINGASQNTVSTPANCAFFPTIAADPVTNNTVYLAGGPNSRLDNNGNVQPLCGVQKSTNGGSTWTQVLPQYIQQSICTCPNNSNRVYAAGTASIFRTDNGGTTWSGNLAANAGFINNGQITDVNVCSGNSDIVYATLGGYTAGQKVMYSTNAGASWFSISGTLPAEVKVNCVVADQNNNAYIGTDMGVYYQAATSSDWTPYYNELPRVPITDLAINQGASRIRASTYGHGIWETSLFTTCDVNLTLPSTIAGNKFYQASNFISASGNTTIVGGNTTVVNARAGGEVYMGPDFTVYEGNVFNATLGACGSSPVPGPVSIRASDIPPVFLSQADRGNDSTLYQYGFITIDPPVGEIATVHLNAVKTGEFLIIVSDKSGSEDLLRISETLAAGAVISKTLALASFAKGKYYVQLYFNGKLAHVQELLVK